MTPPSRWAVRLRIDNLLDREYETLIGFPGTGRGTRLFVGYRAGSR